MKEPGWLRVIAVFAFSISAFTQVPKSVVESQQAKLPAQSAQIRTLSQTQAPLTLTLSADLLNAQTGQNIHFTADWHRELYRLTYHFDWGDGEFYDITPQGKHSLVEAYHVYQSAGTYAVRVTSNSASPTVAAQRRGINSNDLVITITQAVSSGAKKKPKPPAPVLTLNTDTAEVSADQRAHATTAWNRDTYVENYHFDWGDGHGDNVTKGEAYHVYSKPGPYTVRVVAQALVDDRTREIPSNEITITVAAPNLPPTPVATLSANRHKAPVGQEVTFTVNLDPAIPVERYRFSFGDGHEQESSSSQIVHSYERADDFRATVIAWISGGNQTVFSGPLEVVVFTLPQVLNVVAISKEFFVNRETILEASLDPPNKAVRYEFDWGDGSQHSLADARGVGAHRYDRANSYPVIVTAFTEEAHRFSLQKRLILNVRPVPLLDLGWPLTLGQWLLILAGAATVLYAARKIIHPGDHPRPELHVDGFCDAGIHILAKVDRSVPQLSIRLRAGMDSAEHEMIFPRTAAASD
jgi:PKD repeat protein